MRFKHYSKNMQDALRHGESLKGGYMTIKRSSLLINVFAGFAIILGAVLLLYLSWNANSVTNAVNNRFYCNILAAEFRAYSDELTRQVQLHAVTGEKSAEDAYYHALDVLYGKAPRPANALVAPGEKRVFLELMREYGITDEEFALVNSANVTSDNLVILEVEAQHAVKGIFQNADGEYTVYGEPDLERARSLVFGAAYWTEVAQIMAEMDKFQAKVNERTDIAIKKIEKSQRVAQFISFVALAMVAALSVIMVNLDKAKRKADIENRQKSDFIAAVSHEIRTPMNTIMGITEMQLHGEQLTDNLREAFDRIHFSGDLLLSIINDLLDLSKIEAGKLEIKPVKYEMASLINEVIQLNKLRFSSSTLEFKLQIGENVPETLVGDELRIKQVLNNILSNAFKYTLKGGIVLSVNAETGGGENMTLVFVVNDTGQGMTEEQLGRLYEKFTRFNLKSNRKIEGTGLGMSITQSLISIMNGSIHVESRPGKGSTFTVRLPQKLNGMAADPRSVLSKELAESLNHRRVTSPGQVKRTQILRKYMPYGNVLIVDDTEANLYVAKLLIAPYGLKIDTAVSGYEAIDKIKAGRIYDIIFMDHMMPVMDGMEAVKIIRGMGYPHLIVALTANAVVGQADIFLANGFDDFVSKPIDMRLLDVILNKYIHDKQTPEVLAAANREKEELESQAEAGSAASQSPSVNLDGSDPQSGGFQPAEPLSLDVPGMNAGRGLALFDGELDTYLSALRSYTQNVPEMLDKLRIVTEENLPEYAITVHALKSISGWISADSIRAGAANLEALAKAGDLLGVTTLNKDLMDELETFISDLRVQLEDYQLEDD
jgi:signal transduction histidine kinase/CheY-like chemotaxis protein/HPt (histidine-containing phosphotransfer) domain-containing protein